MKRCPRTKCPDVKYGDEEEACRFCGCILIEEPNFLASAGGAPAGPPAASPHPAEASAAAGLLEPPQQPIQKNILYYRGVGTEFNENQFKKVDSIGNGDNPIDPSTVPFKHYPIAVILTHGAVAHQDKHTGQPIRMPVLSGFMQNPPLAPLMDPSQIYYKREVYTPGYNSFRGGDKEVLPTWPLIKFIISRSTPKHIDLFACLQGSLFDEIRANLSFFQSDITFCVFSGRKSTLGGDSPEKIMTSIFTENERNEQEDILLQRVGFTSQTLETLFIIKVIHRPQGNKLIAFKMRAQKTVEAIQKQDAFYGSWVPYGDKVANKIQRQNAQVVTLFGDEGDPEHDLLRDAIAKKLKPLSIKHATMDAIDFYINRQNTLVLEHILPSEKKELSQVFHQNAIYALQIDWAGFFKIMQSKFKELDKILDPLDEIRLYFIRAVVMYKAIQCTLFLFSLMSAEEKSDALCRMVTLSVERNTLPLNLKFLAHCRICDTIDQRQTLLKEVMQNRGYNEFSEAALAEMKSIILTL